MIHYHGTPIGGPGDQTARFLTARHALVSFRHQQDMAVVADVCQSFVLDNGAFSHWKSGEQFSTGGDLIRAYLDWVLPWMRHPRFDWCLIPDTITGSEAENDELEVWWCNEIAKRRHILPTGFDSRSVPVWHMHESLDRLRRQSHKFQTVALGSSGQWATPGTDGWWRRMEQAMDAVCDNGQPRCRLHGLRMLDPAIFTRLPLASADSTNAGRNNNQLSRFGVYPPPTASQRAAVIAARIESFNSAAVWQHDQQELSLCL